MFIKDDLELASIAVSKMCTNKHSKVAGKIVESSGLNPTDFPKLLERLNKNALRYFINSDDLCLYQLIELTYDSPEMLAIIVEDLEFQGKKFKDSWQLGLASFLLRKFPDLPVREPIKSIVKAYKPRNAKGPSKTFSPLQPEFDLTLELPQSSVIFVDTIEKLNNMHWTGPIAGIDCEWRATLVRFKKYKVSIMQIAFEDIIYIVDMIALNLCPELDQKLSELMQGGTYKLGVSFEGDRRMMQQSYPHLEAFKKPMVNYIDVVSAYARVEGQTSGGLAGACELVLGTGLCKYEQRSNWETRPLRDSQLHYCALDAYVQILIIKRLMEKSGLTIQDFNEHTDKAKAGIPSCDNCGSKLHNSKVCSRGKRCKICYKTGHKSSQCLD
jgi:3'-5' exonuclease